MYTLSLFFLLAVCFYPSSQKDLNKEFVKHVAKEERSIFFATSRLTDRKVIESLIKAHRQGVVVEVVVDHKGAKQNSPIWQLVDAGIKVYFWGEKGKQMKHRFCLFHERALWQGPHAYSAKHREGALVLELKEESLSFLEEFKKLKEEGALALSRKE